MLWKFDAVVALEKISGEFEMTLVAGGAVELDESKLDFGMAGEERFFIGAGTVGGGKQVVDEAQGDVEKSAVTRSPVAGEGGLEKVTDVVKFVAPTLDFGCHALGGALANVVS